MKKFFSVLAILTFSLSAVAQISNTRSEEKDDFKKMSFEVGFDKGNYLLLEPIVVEFKFSNQLGIPQTVDIPSFMQESKLKVIFEGKTLIFEHLSSLGGAPGVRFPNILQHNESFAAKEIISSSFAGAFFSKPGNYQLQFILCSSDGTRTIESNVIKVKIENPQDINKEAFNFLQKHKQYFGMSSWDYGGRDGEVLLEAFVDGYSQSVYGEFAINSLGNVYLAGGKLDKARAEFEKLKFSRNNILANDAKQSLSDIEKRKVILEKAKTDDPK